MYPTLIALLFTAKLFMIFLLILIACLSSTSFARQETAAGCLRDIVRVMKYRRETSEETSGRKCTNDCFAMVSIRDGWSLIF